MTFELDRFGVSDVHGVHATALESRIAASRRPCIFPRRKPASTGRERNRASAVFTIDELAIYLKLPKRTLYKLAQKGTIPGHKVGRHWRFHRETIDRWLTDDATTTRRGTKA